MVTAEVDEMYLKKKLISIIIPVFNRGDMVGETLNSLINQTYNHWECIIVDDGSNDDTLEVLERFSRLDQRIRFHRRPANRAKGSNSCRNYGFEKSRGNYIIWFDSDDLMTSNHIEEKVRTIENAGSDFVVAQTANFEDGVLLEPYRYEKKPYGLRAEDFILLKIHWYTYDVLVKREVAQKVRWNEKMKSWQDYNYFCKMLLVTENGIYVDKVLTHRRLHTTSIQSALTKDQQTFCLELLENRLLTYKDIHRQLDSATEKELIFGLMNLCFEIARYGSRPIYLNEVAGIVKNRIGRKAFFLFLTSVVASRLTGKGHMILDLAKGR